jgi:hypothetical protein
MMHEARGALLRGMRDPTLMNAESSCRGPNPDAAGHVARIRHVGHTITASMPRFKAPKSVWLLLQSFGLAWSASAIGSGSRLDEVLSTLLGRRHLPLQADPACARRAAVVACKVLARLRLGMDTCLTRSLVIAALLSDRPSLCLHLGFAPPAEAGGAPMGHAWVTLSSHNVSDDPSSSSGPTFRDVYQRQLRRKA